VALQQHLSSLTDLGLHTGPSIEAHFGTCLLERLVDQCAIAASRFYKVAQSDSKSLTKLSAEHPAMAPNNRECAVSSFSGRRPAEHGHHQVCTCYTTEGEAETSHLFWPHRAHQMPDSRQESASTLCQCVSVCNVTPQQHIYNASSYTHNFTLSRLSLLTSGQQGA